MLYRASDTIAGEHPEIADWVRAIDEYLHARQGQKVRLGQAVNYLNIEPKALERVLELYRVHGIVESVQVWICPEDGELLEEDREGQLVCDICDTSYKPDDCQSEIAYQVRPSAPSASVPTTRLFTNGFALTVGVGTYRILSPLHKTVADANDLFGLLTDPARCGYSVAQVVRLLDNEATKAAISDKLDKLARRTGPEDTVLIFFSGHGAQRVGGFEPGEYLCPVEADGNNLRTTSISANEFTTALRAIRAGRVVVFLDACHSGGVGQPKDTILNMRPGLSEETYDRLAEGRGRVIIASCRPNEVSWELPEMQNGLFTHYLLEALRGAAAKADGTVCILDLFSYVSDKVRKHKPQNPLLKGEIEQNFPIALAPLGNT
jgi:hypothetical protein